MWSTNRLKKISVAALLTAILLPHLPTIATADTLYVDLNNAAPVAPYTNWVTAATNIQDAVDAASSGDMVLVTNGLYQTGTRIAGDGTQNRVVVTNAIVVQSLNGPAVTTIDGSATVRCAYLTNSAVLSGFTVSNGRGGNGGGVFCGATTEVLLNCLLINNIGVCGGGVYAGTLTNCTLSGNRSGDGTVNRGGGAYGSVLNNCTLTNNATGNNSGCDGGGAFGCTLNGCTLVKNATGLTYGCGGGACNSALNSCTVSGNKSSDGGGVAYSTAARCVISGNTSYDGGGSFSSTLINCTLLNNSAGNGGGASRGTLNGCIVRSNTANAGGGTSSWASLVNCTVTGNWANNGGGGTSESYPVNCIIYFNQSGLGAANCNGGTVNYSCTTPLPSGGVGNVSSDPLFINYAAGDLHLQTNSPCIETGSNASVTFTNDLDGNPRIVGTVDMGAYEFPTPTYIMTQPQSQTAYGTLPATFSVVAVSPFPLTYQWLFNGTNIASETNSTLTLTNLQATNAGSYSVCVTTSLRSITSSNAVLTVLFPRPSITSQPISQTVVLGSNVAFSVSAFSPYPMAFQWQRNGTNVVDDGQLAGVTSAALSISGVQRSHAGPYQLIVTNFCGAVTSSAVWLTVLAEPVILAQPADLALSSFSTTSLSVTVTGAPPFYYQWLMNGTNLADAGSITGALSATLTINTAQTTDSGQYSVVVSNAFGTAQTTNALLTVVPIVLWGNAGMNVPAGATNIIAISAGGDFGSGTLNLALRGDGTVAVWGGGLYGSTLVPDSASNVVAIAAGEYHGLALRQDGSVVAWGENNHGEASPPPEATNVVAVAAGQFHSLALRQDGTVVGWGNSVPPAGISNIIAVSGGSGYSLGLRQDGTVLGWGSNNSGVASPPADVTNIVAIAAGYFHGLALRADGSLVTWGYGMIGQLAVPPAATNIIAIAAGASLSLALRNDGAIIGWGLDSYGDTTAPANLKNVVAICAKEYNVMAQVMDPTSRVPPRVVQQPSSCTAFLGQPLVLMSQVTGSLPLQYQWYFNGAAVDGQTNNWLASTTTGPSQAGDYQVVATNSAGAVTSRVATLTVSSAPAIAAQPTNQSVLLTSNALFTVSAYGLPPFSYRWRFNGAPATDDSHFSGTTTASLVVSNVQDPDGAGYSVIVTNTYGSVTSAVATLTVLEPPIITNQPTDRVVLSGSNAVFTVGARGPGGLSYRWTRGGTNLSNGGSISGATSPTLTILAAQTNDQSAYRVIVSNGYGATTSLVANLWIYLPAQITSHPASMAVLVGSNASFTATGAGTALGYQWYRDGVPFADGGRISGSSSPMLVISNVQNEDVGGYWVVVSNPVSSARSLMASLTPLQTSTASVRYVSLSSASPAPPYLNWSTAATNIQDAVDAAVDGDLILVADGVYRTGGRVVYGSLTNRLVVSKAVTVQSVNGAPAVMIVGSRPASDTAVRCVYLTNKACLIGLTLTNGAARSAGDMFKERCGGGAWCESTNCLLINCLITSNAVAVSGGGVYSGTCSNCVLTYNSATTNGGGAFGGLLDSCTLRTNVAANGGGACSNGLDGCTLLGNKATSVGGGAYGSTLNKCLVALNAGTVPGGGIGGCVVNGCVISNNSCGGSYGGGVYNSVLTNCLILNNVGGLGGGAYNSVLNACWVSGNSAGGSGGGVYSSTANNCLICSNTAPMTGAATSSSLNNCTVVGHTTPYAVYSCVARNCVLFYNSLNYSGGSCTNCCTTPLPAGPGNFTNPPSFVGLTEGNFRLQTNSPCINAGNNAYALTATDLDGLSRLVAGTVDIGAYECQSPALLGFFLWMQSYGLPTAAFAIYADADNDGQSNWQEWVQGTNPTNAASALRLQTPLLNTPGLVLRWSSDTNCAYFIQRATSLNPPISFTTLQSDIPGLPNTTSFTDTNPPPAGPAYYRVGVQQ